MKIELSKIFNSETLSTRKSVGVIDFELEKVAHGDSKIDVDFSNIFQVSRSFADEILNLRRNYKLRGININFVNTNDSINTMLELVSRKAESKSPVSSINVSASTILDLGSL